MPALAFGWESARAPALVMIGVSGLMMLTALYGCEGMYWVSLISMPLILVLAFWITALGEVSDCQGLFYRPGGGDGVPAAPAPYARSSSVSGRVPAARCRSSRSRRSRW